MRKQGPKKVWGIERKRSQNGTHIGARKRQHFKKYEKKNNPQNDAKKSAERNLQIEFECRPRSAQGLISGQRGGSVFDSVLIQGGSYPI